MEEVTPLPLAWTSRDEEIAALREQLKQTQRVDLEEDLREAGNAITDLREQLAKTQRLYDEQNTNFGRMLRNLGRERDELRSQLEQAQKRIYDAGMMLCCVNDIEQNPLEDLIKGNLQMLAGYHESEKRLMAQLEQARADVALAARAYEELFLAANAIRATIEILRCEPHHHEMERLISATEAIDAARTQENTKPL